MLPEGRVGQEEQVPDLNERMGGGSWLGYGFGAMSTTRSVDVIGRSPMHGRPSFVAGTFVAFRCIGGFGTVATLASNWASRMRRRSSILLIGGKSAMISMRFLQMSNA